ncbi:Fpg/Nei family DNA glycosylase [Paenibacillus bovis]|uniref:Formamidopyrimidine-DNA glycosylase catalytic domain-containing protein n=1 Tax=Paenibacillus bovis TaxID=1616788 RepID=A0A172ZI70_9BACL|nr:DNA-formamidopyrimidine glycosylase family protein [Paenibacillus bovis]ANF97219.1 hypothetical protein AR543_15240 [Paenibacillus bovis]
MPELPELENYKIQLTGYILNVAIEKMVVHRPKATNMEADHVNLMLAGNRVAFIERRGKYLNLHLHSGHRLLISIVLGSSLYYGIREQNADRKSDVELQFEDGTSLYYTAGRQGLMYFCSAKETQAYFADLGPEATDRKLTREQFITLFKSRRGALKTALINQSLIAGIGSYYADEIAFTAGLLPSAKVQDLDEEALSKLYDAVHSVLEEAIETGGHMEGQPLTANDALTGGFHALRRVYEREGEPSVRSATDKVVKTEVAGKKTYYCPASQFEQ